MNLFCTELHVLPKLDWIFPSFLQVMPLDEIVASPLALQIHSVIPHLFPLFSTLSLFILQFSHLNKNSNEVILTRYMLFLQESSSFYHFSKCTL